MSKVTSHIIGAVIAGLVAWALFGLFAGVITTAVALIVVLVVNRDTDGPATSSVDGVPAAFPGDQAVWTCSGCGEIAGLRIPQDAMSGFHAASCGACGHETRVEVRDRDCPKGHMIGAHGRCIHCGYVPQTVNR